MFGLLRRRPHERTGFELYSAAVAAAREPWAFAVLGVPDSLAGRFDLISMHVALLIRRLRADPDPRGALLGQAVFDAMFADMDVNLREMGVGDMSIGKRVKGLWEAWHGRTLAYEAALDAGDSPALAAAISRNIFAGHAAADAAGPQALAAYAEALAAALAAQPLAGLLSGQLRFPPTPGDIVP
ncbi:cytochrome b pre-mRNA-processing protein 3 [Humitalea rosea]|uniref:Cytochrome b pre-mRNA-processing protein 3 n=1 Tax=Humitalea rosea TaxID=990373 RepID=A0A2W7IT13_9PROT|nr:ubiquinol-cytochrome C chaperone family protein [Humitalea rosea]PZW50986.1 cytochrome b pre-mRNA-processing protein 3 [Humitalea rosea]